MTERQKILIVDDREENLIALRKALAEVDAEIVEATSGNQALAATLDHDFAMAILDVQMPGMSGYELAEHLRSDSGTAVLPIVFVTASYADEQHMFRGYAAGGTDYIIKPIAPEVLLGKTRTFLEIDRYKRELERHRDHLDSLVRERTQQLRDSEERYRTLFANIADPVFVYDGETHYFLDCNQSVHERYGYRIEELRTMTPVILHPPDERAQVVADVAVGRDLSLKRYTHVTKDGERFPVEIHTANVEYLGKRARISIVRDITERMEAEAALRRSLWGSIHAIAATTEGRDPYTAGHQRRVTELAARIGEEIGLEPERVDALRITGLMHDIGKISIPAEILSKPTRLTDVEMALVRNHPQTAYDILRNIEFPWPVAEFVLQHHERIDGSGYPNGLRGDQIHLEARVIAVADVVEAISSHRPYRAALGLDVALEEITKNAGRLYDESVVDACVRLFREQEFRFDSAGPG